MERIGVLAVLAASFFMAACNVDLTISAIVPDNPTSLSKPAFGELVSTSSQFEHSAGRGYLIQASAGSMTTDQILTSNVRGYKLYQGVQAQIISADPR